MNPSIQSSPDVVVEGALSLEVLLKNWKLIGNYFVILKGNSRYFSISLDCELSI